MRQQIVQLTQRHRRQDMKHIELKCGFICDLPDNVMDNMELVDTLAEEDEENPITLSHICKLIYGNDNRKKLYDCLRTEDGRVPITEIATAIKETFQQYGKVAKKS